MNLQQMINDTLKLCEQVDKRLLGEWERGYLQSQIDFCERLQQRLNNEVTHESPSQPTFFK